MIDSFIEGATPIAGDGSFKFEGAGTLGPAPSPISFGKMVQFTSIVGQPPPVPSEIRPDLDAPGGENDVRKR